MYREQEVSRAGQGILYRSWSHWIVKTYKQERQQSRRGHTAEACGPGTAT